LDTVIASQDQVANALRRGDAPVDSTFIRRYSTTTRLISHGPPRASASTSMSNRHYVARGAKHGRVYACDWSLSVNLITVVDYFTASSSPQHARARAAFFYLSHTLCLVSLPPPPLHHLSHPEPRQRARKILDAARFVAVLLLALFAPFILVAPFCALTRCPFIPIPVAIPGSRTLTVRARAIHGRAARVGTISTHRDEVAARITTAQRRGARSCRRRGEAADIVVAPIWSDVHGFGSRRRWFGDRGLESPPVA
jgi:hypothetical protein